MFQRDIPSLMTTSHSTPSPNRDSEDNSRDARWIIFQIWVNFGGPYNGKCL
jgi:hypothetical protein